MSTLIRLEHLSAEVRLPDGERLTTVDDVSASFERGTSTAIIGKSGSGKTSLASIVGLLNNDYDGTLSYDGRDCAAWNDADRARFRCRHVGFVFQNPENQIVFPIVREDLAFGLKHLEPDRAQREARIEAELAALGVAHLADRTSHTLSGGERQLVALAAVLVMRPGLVVFDEPTTQLDLRNRNRVRDAIAAMPQDAIVVSHDLALLEDFERVLVIQDGAIAADDQPAAALRWYRNHCA